jgi:large subunit ribosomal protein L23
MTEEKAPKIKEEKKEKAKKEAAGFSLGEESADLACQVLLEPWITEKSHQAMELNKYIFKITGRGDKNKIKKSIESLYKVTVEKVNIVNIPPKKKFVGRKEGKKPGYKKATITLKEGDKIELFEGV